MAGADVLQGPSPPSEPASTLRPLSTGLPLHSPALFAASTCARRTLPAGASDLPSPTLTRTRRPTHPTPRPPTPCLKRLTSEGPRLAVRKLREPMAAAPERISLTERLYLGKVKLSSSGTQPNAARVPSLGRPSGKQCINGLAGQHGFPAGRGSKEKPGLRVKGLG